MVKRNMSDAGRAACSAAGRANIEPALEARRAALPAVKAASGAFEAALAAEVGAAPTAAQRGLILAATASYTALFIVLEKLRAARRFKRIEVLVEQLTPLQGGLLRSLRGSGLESSGGAGPDPMAALRRVEAEIVAARKPPQEEDENVEAAES